MDSARLLRQTRQRAGLSVRALAARTDIATSTITRIEAGTVDPSVGTLAQLLAGCGYRLAMEAKASRAPQLADLAYATTTVGGDERPDWTRFRALLDHLARDPDQRWQTILLPPPPDTPPVQANLIAGIAETIADALDRKPPRWTNDIAPLTERWETPGTPRMHEQRAATTPPRLAARRFELDRSTLWRDPQTVGLEPA